MGAAELSFRYIEQPIRNGALGGYWAHLRTADGWRRWQIAGRGALVVSPLSAIAVVLCMSLAAAHSPDPAIPGVNQADHDDERVRDRPIAAALTEPPTTVARASTTTTDTKKRPTVPVTEPKQDRGRGNSKPSTTRPHATTPPTTAKPKPPPTTAAATLRRRCSRSATCGKLGHAARCSARSPASRSTRWSAAVRRRGHAGPGVRQVRRPAARRRRPPRHQRRVRRRPVRRHDERPRPRPPGSISSPPGSHGPGRRSSTSGCGRGQAVAQRPAHRLAPRREPQPALVRRRRDPPHRGGPAGLADLVHDALLRR